MALLVSRGGIASSSGDKREQERQKRAGVTWSVSGLVNGAHVM